MSHTDLVKRQLLTKDRLKQKEILRKKNITIYSEIAISGKSPYGRILSVDERTELLIRSIWKRFSREKGSKVTKIPAITPEENYAILKLLLEDPVKVIKIAELHEHGLRRLLFNFKTAHFGALAKELSGQGKIYSFFSALARDGTELTYFGTSLARGNSLESFFKPLNARDMELAAKAMGHGIQYFIQGLFSLAKQRKGEELVAQSLANALKQPAMQEKGRGPLAKIYNFTRYMGVEGRVFARELAFKGVLDKFLLGLGENIGDLAAGFGVKIDAFVFGAKIIHYKTYLQLEDRKYNAVTRQAGITQLANGISEHFREFSKGLWREDGVKVYNNHATRATDVFRACFDNEEKEKICKILEQNGIPKNSARLFLGFKVI